MKVQFAGVDCTCYNEAVAAHLEAFCDPNEILQFEPIASHNLYHLPIPPAFSPPPVRINVLHWPADASRFATCWLVVDDTDLATLRPLCFTTSGPVGQNLVFTPEATDDYQIETITAFMVALPPRPLTQFGDGTTGMWLLPLVDQRYFWWTRSASFSVGGSWANQVATVGASLGISMPTSTIAADYGAPSERYTAYQQPIPIYLDAVARTIGQRVIANLDGSVQLQNYDDSVTVRNAQVAMDTTRLPRSGGLFNADDLNQSVPSSVVGVFAKTVDGVRSNVPYTVSKTLTSLTLLEYAGISGYSGEKVAYGAPIATIITASGVNATNLTALQNYVAQTAKDWYLWALNDADLQYEGIVNWPPNGQADAIEWQFFADRCSTRILRDPYNEWSWGSLHQLDFLDQATIVSASGTSIEFRDDKGGSVTSGIYKLDDSTVTDDAGVAHFVLDPRAFTTNFKDDKGNTVTSDTEKLKNSTVANVAGEAVYTIDDTSATAPGIINLVAQTIGDGNKTFKKTVYVNADADNGVSGLYVNNLIALSLIDDDSQLIVEKLGGGGGSFVVSGIPGTSRAHLICEINGYIVPVNSASSGVLGTWLTNSGVNTDLVRIGERSTASNAGGQVALFAPTTDSGAASGTFDNDELLFQRIDSGGVTLVPQRVGINYSSGPQVSLRAKRTITWVTRAGHTGSLDDVYAYGYIKMHESTENAPMSFVARPNDGSNFLGDGQDFPYGTGTSACMSLGSNCLVLAPPQSEHGTNYLYLTTVGNSTQPAFAVEPTSAPDGPYFGLYQISGITNPRIAYSNPLFNFAGGLYVNSKPVNKGDILIASDANTLIMLPAGTLGQKLTMLGTGLPGWA